MISSLPPSLDAAGLAGLLYMSEETIKRNVTRSPKLLPPFVPLGKGHIWLTPVVYSWMEKRMSEPVIFKIEFVSSSINSESGGPQPPKMRSLAEDLMPLNGSSS